ncbi:MAG: hypothetical protein AAF928_17485 [Myxococcota bacterium]
MSPAKRIFEAIVRTGTYHRRNAIVAGLIALASCALAVSTERPQPKGVALLMAIGFGVFTYRSLRRAALYLDVRVSPVLEALTRSPQRIVDAHAEGASAVVVTDDGGAQLQLLVGDHDAPAALLDALASHRRRDDPSSARALPASPEG